MHFPSWVFLTLSCLLLIVTAFPSAYGNSELISRDPRPTPEQQTDGLLFLTPMKSFLEAKRAKQPANLIWKDNGCDYLNKIGNGLPYGNFLYSCQRHDFGYRNYKAQRRCSENQRGKIDENFKKDMFNRCDEQFHSWFLIVQKGQCREAALVIFSAVRLRGEGHFC
jgi:Prokaryotic phospholipase A2